MKTEDAVKALRELKESRLVDRVVQSLLNLGKFVIGIAEAQHDGARAGGPHLCPAIGLVVESRQLCLLSWAPLSQNHHR